jgi:hypothetical protein
MVGGTDVEGISFNAIVSFGSKSPEKRYYIDE